MTVKFQVLFKNDKLTINQNCISYPYHFWAHIEFHSNPINPVFSNKHALRATKSTKSSVAREISEANPSHYPHIWYFIHIIRMKHSTFKDSKWQIQWISGIVINFKIQCKHLPFICKSNLNQIMSLINYSTTSIIKKIMLIINSRPQTMGRNIWMYKTKGEKNKIRSINSPESNLLSNISFL